MGDFNTSRTYTYVAGAIIYAINHTTNENNIYTAHNDAFHETTGHGHTGATGDGPLILGTGIANNAVNFNHIDWGTGAGQVDGTETTTWKISKDAANELILAHASLTDDRTWTFSDVSDTVTGVTATQTLTNKTLTNPTINLNSGKAIVFNADTTSNTDIRESSANVIQIRTGGTSALSIQNSVVSVSSGRDLVVQSGKIVALNASRTSFIYEPIANQVTIGTSSANQFSITSTGAVIVRSGQELNLDGTTTVNSIRLAAANQINIKTNSVDALTISANQDVVVRSNKKLILDGSVSGDTYIISPNNNNISFYADAVKFFDINNDTTDDIRVNTNINFIPSGSPSTPIANSCYRESLAKVVATVTYNGTNWVFTGGHNVASITSTSSSNFTINFATSFTTTSFTCTSGSHSSTYNVFFGAKATGSVVVRTSVGATTNDIVSVAIFGTQ